MNSFLNYITHEKRYSGHTVISYTKDLEQFLHYLQSTYQIDVLLAVNHNHVRSWIVHMMNEKISARSVNRKISCLRSFYQFHKKRNQISLNPMSKVIAPKTGKRLMTFVPEAQMHHLLDGGIFDNDFSGVRDRLILEMLYLTGMRRSELIHLKNGDVHMGSRYVRVLGKGRKERNIPIPDGLVRLIREYLDLRASEFGTLGTDRLFVTDKGQELYPKFVYNKVRHYLSLVTTLERKSPHVIRHSFATHLSNKGAELNAIKTLLGHQSLAATQIYTHNDIAKLKAVYEKSHPKAR